MKFDEFINLIPVKWQGLLAEELKSENMTNIYNFLDKEYKTKEIFPNIDDIFASLKFFDPKETRVVIIGQDPYHIPWVANGLAFSTNGKKIPQSLRNIYKEICDEFDLSYLDKRDSLTWDLNLRAKQWVLLLNNCLSVQAHKPLSHNNIWWQHFTNCIIKKLSNNNDNLVFLLWWWLAHSKENYIDVSKHLILKSAHPSPLSANRWFFGCWHFIKTNKYLDSKGKWTIKWI